MLEYLVAFILSNFVLGTTGDTQVHFSTIYGTPGDIYAQQVVPHLGRKLRPDDALIAHRTLPKGTRVRLTNLRNGRKTVSMVRDRGNFGSCTYPGWVPISNESVLKPRKCPKGYWVIKKKADGPGVWRAGFDLTPPVAARLGHNGFDLVKLEVLR